MKKKFCVFIQLLFVVMIYFWSFKLLLLRLSMIKYFEKYLHMFNEISRYELLFNILLILLIPYVFFLNIKLNKLFSVKKMYIFFIPLIIIIYVQFILMFNL